MMEGTGVFVEKKVLYASFKGNSQLLKALPVFQIYSTIL